MRMACTRSGCTCWMVTASFRAALESVNGPNHWRSAVRSPSKPEPQSRRPGKARIVPLLRWGLAPVSEKRADFAPLKATGMVLREASLSAGLQAKVETRWTSYPPATKYSIQFRAVGERPSATNKIRMSWRVKENQELVKLDEAFN